MSISSCKLCPCHKLLRVLIVPWRGKLFFKLNGSYAITFNVLHAIVTLTKCPRNGVTKQSKAANSSFPCVFNRIALARAASGFMILDEIVSSTEISSFTVKLLVVCRMEGDAWSSLSTSVSTEVPVRSQRQPFYSIMKWWNIQNNSSTSGVPRITHTSGCTARFAALSYRRPVKF